MSIHTTMHNATNAVVTGGGGVRAAAAKLRGALAQAAAHLTYVRSAPRADKGVDMKVSFVLNPGMIVELVPDADTGRVAFVAYNAGGTDVANGAFDVRGTPGKPRVGKHTIRFSSRATPARKRLLRAVMRALAK
jgi:hypothetical protein